MRVLQLCPFCLLHFANRTFLGRRCSHDAHPRQRHRSDSQHTSRQHPNLCCVPGSRGIVMRTQSLTGTVATMPFTSVVPPTFGPTSPTQCALPAENLGAPAWKHALTPCVTSTAWSRQTPPRPSPPAAATRSLQQHLASVLPPPHSSRPPPQQDTAWQELPDRHMVWAPTHDQSAGEWCPEWICLRCNATVEPNHTLLQSVPPTPACPEHGLRSLVLDLHRHERGWGCCHGTSPPRFQQCAPQQIHAPEWHPTSGPTNAMLHQPPPKQRAPGPTNSWLYVPLLHAGAHRLATLQEHAATSGTGTTAAGKSTDHTTCSSERATTPRHRGTFAGALNILTFPTGYIAATAQETLLQCYLGGPWGRASSTPCRPPLRVEISNMIEEERGGPARMPRKPQWDDQRGFHFGGGRGGAS